MGLGGPRAWVYLLKRDGGQDCSWGEGGATDTGGACRPPPRTAPPVSQDIPRLGTPTARQPPPWVGGEWRPRVGQGHPVPTQPAGPPPDSWQGLHHPSSPRLPLPYPSQARSPAQGPCGDPCLPQVSPPHQGTREGGGPRSQLWLGPPLPVPQAPASHAWTIQGSPGPCTDPSGTQGHPRNPCRLEVGWRTCWRGLRGTDRMQAPPRLLSSPGHPRWQKQRPTQRQRPCSSPGLRVWRATGDGEGRDTLWSQLPHCPVCGAPSGPPLGGGTQHPLLSWTLHPASTSGSGTTPRAPWPSRPTALAMDQVRLAPPPAKRETPSSPLPRRKVLMHSGPGRGRTRVTPARAHSLTGRAFGHLCTSFIP